MKKLIFILLFPTFNLFAFTFNNSGELAFNSFPIKIYIASYDCTNIPFSNNQIASMTKQAIDQFWNTINVSKLAIEYHGQKTVSDSFRTEAICSETSGSGSCTPNSNLAFSEGILIACNVDSGNQNFSAGVLGLSVPMSTSGTEIKGSIVLLNDRSDSQLISMSEEELTAVIAHEVGHALGLGHSTEKGALMYPSMVTKRKKLGLDDIYGISYLYPIESNFQTCATISLDSAKGSKSGLFFGLGFTLIFLSYRSFRRSLSKRKLKASPLSS